MIYQPAAIQDDLGKLPKRPAWATAGRAKNSNDAAFLSGAVLCHLHHVLQCEDIPQALLRERLALRAAEICVGHAGRIERMAELRDVVAFLQPGDTPGPAGEVYMSWQRAVARPVSLKGLHQAMPSYETAQIAQWLEAGQGGPVPSAASVLQSVLEDHPRGGLAARICADAALARALGWSHVVPLLALGLSRADLRKTGMDLALACHRAVLVTMGEVEHMAQDLARRATALRSVAPKLRAKKAGEAVEIFLSRDAVAPSALPLPDRSARRLCDRLVALGALREVTGRDTFRLYGV